MQENIIEKQVLTVTDLNRSVKRLLESHFKVIWVEGEISNLAKPQSGHIYFTLKDAQAQVRCALFRTRHNMPLFQLENGMHILACAKISIYEGRGDYQLIVEHVEERGEGLLRRRFEALKNKLLLEGLFESSHKQPLPFFPKCIGVVTSPTGAAIKDVLCVLKRRFPSIPVIIYPTPVQGEQAARHIAAAILLASVRKECDVLLICRGGGSLEDLWAFNEEIVARAIFQCQLPTVSGVGHQIDVTITDFVVDASAPTPSAAAEVLSPNKKDYYLHIASITSRLVQFISAEIKHKKLQLASCQKGISAAQQIVQKFSQAVDIAELVLKQNMLSILGNEKRKIALLAFTLNHFNPRQQLKQYHTQLKNTVQLLDYHLNKKLSDAKQSLLGISKTLHIVSPLNTLERGYSIATYKGHVIENTAQVKVGNNIQIEVRTGYLYCHVTRIQEKN